ncbi:MAG: hypothetical protein OXG72_18205 [Acidobacteria bacterium]|nr:hypothetical protein [Acidobacteriota bacterium]
MAFASLLLGVGAAAAQTSTILASNVGQTNTGDSAFHVADYAQRFATGSHADGYRLTSVKLKLHSVAGTPTYSVQIRNSVAGSVMGSFLPGTTTLATLTNPSSLSVGLNTFTAPGGGIDVDPSTNYFVLLDTSGSAPSPRLDVTTSDSDDSGVVWFIGSASHYMEPDDTAWTRWASSLQLVIEGHTLPVDTDTDTDTGTDPDTDTDTDTDTGTDPDTDTDTDTDTGTDPDTDTDTDTDTGTDPDTDTDTGTDPDTDPDPDPPSALRVTAACEPCEVPPGGEVRLTAKARYAASDTLTYAWSAPGGSWNGETDGAVARWTAPSRTGEIRIQVSVSDGLSTRTATVTVTVEPEPVPALPAAGLAVLAALVLASARRILARPS